MSSYFSVDITVRFAVLADSHEEAEELARSLTPIEDEIPARARLQVDVYRTPNQSDDLKRSAVNYE